MTDTNGDNKVREQEALNYINKAITWHWSKEINRMPKQILKKLKNGGITFNDYASYGK